MASTTSMISLGWRQFLQIFQLIHQLFVDVQTAGGIQDDNVIAVILGELQRLLGDVARVDLSHLKDLAHPALLANHLQLIRSPPDGRYRRPPAADNVPSFLKYLRQLCGVGGLTGTLQTAHHNDARRLGREIDPGIFIAHQTAQFLVDDLDDLLCRGQAVEHLFAHCARR